jgi:thiol:disulfide interchange protein DsbD
VTRLALLLALALGLVPGAFAQGDTPTPPGSSSWGSLFGGLDANDSQAPVSLALESVPAPAVGEAFRLKVILTHGEGYHTYAPGEELGVPIEVVPGAVDGIEWGTPEFPPYNTKNYPMLGGDVKLYEGVIEIAVPGKVTSEAGRGTSFTIEVRYAACTDTACLLPQSEELAGTWAPAGSSPPPTSAAPAPPAASPSAPAAPPVPGEGADFGRSLEGGLLGALLVAYLWGLAASISPCVYPMIPVTIGFFGGQGEKKRSRPKKVALAFTYVAGIVLSYALVGVAAARAGRDLGSLMANEWVVGGVAAVLIAMGLSLFGLFELHLPSSLQQKLGSMEGDGFFGAFLTGGVMGLVAAPCVGPFAASILLYVAQRGDLLVGFLALGAFGAGIGTLFLFLALGVSELPSSGMWLIHVKKVFGYVLIGAGYYYVTLLLPAAIGLGGWGLFLTVGGVMGGALEPATETGARAWKGLTLAALVAGLYLVVAGLSHQVPLRGVGGAPQGAASAATIPWVHDIDTATARAEAEGKPIFIDFYADWCIPCKQMDREVFPDPEVRAELAAFVPAKLDCTDPESPASQLKTQGLGSLAMPYLAVFDAQGNPRPDLSHSGYLGKQEFRQLLARARAELGA